MAPTGAILAIGLAVTAVLAACAVTRGAAPPKPGNLEAVLVPAGSVLVYGTEAPVTFNVTGPGAAFVGSIHFFGRGFIWPEPVGVFLSCPNPGPVNNWSSYSYNISLQPGEYLWPGGCGSYVNLTVTQAIQLLYPWPT